MLLDYFCLFSRARSSSSLRPPLSKRQKVARVTSLVSLLPLKEKIIVIKIGHDFFFPSLSGVSKPVLPELRPELLLFSSRWRQSCGESQAVSWLLGFFLFCFCILEEEGAAQEGSRSVSGCSVVHTVPLLPSVMVASHTLPMCAQTHTHTHTLTDSGFSGQVSFFFFFFFFFCWNWTEQKV